MLHAVFGSCVVLFRAVCLSAHIEEMADARMLSRVLKPVNLRRANIQFEEVLNPQVHTSLSDVTAMLISGVIPAPKGYVVMYSQTLKDYVLLYTDKSKDTAFMHFGLLECGSSDEEAIPVGYKPTWNHVEPPMSLAALEVPVEESRQRSRSPHLERKNKRTEKQKWLSDAEWKPQRTPVSGYPDHYRVPCGGDLEYFNAKEGSVMWAHWPESRKYYRIRAGDRTWIEYNGEDEGDK